MQEGNEKKIFAVIAVAIIVLAGFVLTTQKEIGKINESIEEIEDQPVSLRILVDTSSGTYPLTVNFKPLLLNVKDDVKYSWDFGDGNTSTEISPSYTYKRSGIFNCILTIEDGDSEIADNFNVTVFPNNPPKIKIKCSETTPLRPTKVFFDAETFDPEGEELQYLWILKYPRFFGIEKNDSYNTKNFSKKFIRNGNYVVELSVTDETGNKVTDYVIIQVGKSQIEQMYDGLKLLIIYTLPGTMELLWKLPFVRDPVSNFLDNHWLDWSPNLQNLTLAILSILHVDYDPPIPKADLGVSKIADINLSAYVNDTTGEVEAGSVASSPFTLINNDSLNTARSIYITLDNPYSEDEGLEKEIEVEELIVDLDVGVMSNKLFYNGEYTNWENCHNIEKIAPGDLINLGITISLREGAILTKGTYHCKLYMYQEKSLDKSDYVDEIPFTIII